MQGKVRRASLRPYRRVLVTSDLHGHGHLLKRLLKEAHFSKDDALIVIGDVVEKGPDSLGTLRCVMELARQENVFVLMGNVDRWRLDLLEIDTAENQQEVIRFSINGARWWGSSIIGEMMTEMGLDIEKDGDRPGLLKDMRLHFQKELDFIRQLPIVLETEHFIFVHGGLPHERVDELKEIDPYRLLKNDDFLGQGLSFEKWVTVGHWPVALYDEKYISHGPHIRPDRHIISVDGGCGVRGDGQLNLLITDWEARAFTHISATDKPEILALDGQAASADPRNIRWHDSVVELMEMGDRWAVVSHHGKKMRVPRTFVYEKDGVFTCPNMTDWELPVEAGEKMQLLFEYDGICYCKKKDICGWYKGRYQKIKETET